MKTHQTLGLLVLFLTPACLNSPEKAGGLEVLKVPEPALQPVAEATHFQVQDAREIPAEIEEAHPRLARQLDLSAGSNGLWRDPVFRQRFTESYIAISDVEPRVTMDERDTLQKVAQLMAEDQHEKATHLLQKEGGPQASAVFDFTLGNLYFQDEQLEKAEVAYSRAEEKYPKFQRAWKNQGLVYFRLEEPGAAAQSLTRVIELGGGDATTYGLLGFSYMALEKPIAAETAYRMAMLLDADTLDWKLGLARSFFQQRRYADAASLCANLITEQPDSADLWLLQGNAFIGLGENLRAAENLEFVDRLGESSPASLNNLGDIYVNEKLFGLAVKAYARALEQSSEHDASRALRASRTIAAQGAFAEVQKLMGSIRGICGKGLGLEQRKSMLKIEARVAVAQGKGMAEAKILEQIIELDPLDGDALILLGRHAGREGDVERGIFYFERAANIEGFEVEAKRRHGQLLVNASRYSEALPFLRRVQSLEPREALKAYIEQVERLARTADK